MSAATSTAKPSGSSSSPQRLEGGEPAFGILLAIAAAEADAAHHFAVDDDGETADEGGEAPFEAQLDAEGLVAGQRGPVRRLGEQMGGALVPGGGERLVPGDLRSGDARPVHALETDGIAALVGDADGLEDADFGRLAKRGIDHVIRLAALELDGFLQRASLCGSNDPGGAGGSSAAAIDGLDLRIELQAGASRFAEGRRAGPLQPAERRVDQVAGGSAVDH